jgi:hypothetical protein
VKETGDTSQPASANKGGIIAKFTSFVSRVCQIPPKPRFHLRPALRSRTPLVVGLATFVIVLSIMLPSFLSWWALHHPDWSWSFQNTGSFEYLDRDFILFNRPFINVSEYPPDQRMGVIDFMNHEGLIGHFRLKDNETAIWQNCTVYTLGAHHTDLEHLRYTWREVEVGDGCYTNVGLEVASAITLTGSTNLTMINVTVDPDVAISLNDRASLRMINCTNMGYRCYVDPNNHTEWPSGAPGPGISCSNEGTITASGNTTLYLDGSTIGKLTAYSENVIIVNSSIQEARVRSGTPPRIVDSQIFELYADEGAVQLLGTTEVSYHVSYQDSGPLLALRVNGFLNKTQVKYGEAISMIFRLENIGTLPLLFSEQGFDKFTILAHSYTTEEEESTVFYDNWNNSYRINWSNPTLSDTTNLHRDTPVPVEYHFPPRLEPGHVFIQTLTWQNPSLQPGKYSFQGQLNSKSLGIWIGCGGDTITVFGEEG